VKAISLARAGVERARMLLVKSAEPDITEETFKDKSAVWYTAAKALARGLDVQGYADKLDTGEISVDIVPEISRRNINRLSRTDWERVFDVAGIPEDKWNELMDCFEDWKDGDDLRRTYGAETDDWYSRLESPYRAKNGPLFTVDELLLIKGFSYSMLYGGPVNEPDQGDDEPGESMSGMDDLLTTFGDGKINVNAASPRVLRTLSGIDDVIAGKIVQDREGYGADKKDRSEHSFKGTDDFFSRFPDLRAVLKDSITTDTGIYRITSSGACGGVTRTVACIVVVDRKTGMMTVNRWQESEGE